MLFLLECVRTGDLQDSRDTRNDLEVGIAPFCDVPFTKQLKDWKKNLVGYVTAEQEEEMDAIRKLVESDPAPSLEQLLSCINSKIQPVSTADQADQRAVIVEALKAAKYKTGRDRKSVKVDTLEKNKKRRDATRQKNDEKKK